MLGGLQFGGVGRQEEQVPVVGDPYLEAALPAGEACGGPKPYAVNASPLGEFQTSWSPAHTIGSRSLGAMRYLVLWPFSPCHAKKAEAGIMTRSERSGRLNDAILFYALGPRTAGAKSDLLVFGARGHQPPFHQAQVMIGGQDSYLL